MEDEPRQSSEWPLLFRFKRLVACESWYCHLPKKFGVECDGGTEEVAPGVPREDALRRPEVAGRLPCRSTTGAHVSILCTEYKVLLYIVCTYVQCTWAPGHWAVVSY